MNMQCRRCLSSMFPKTPAGCEFCEHFRLLTMRQGNRPFIDFVDLSGDEERITPMPAPHKKRPVERR